MAGQSDSTNIASWSTERLIASHMVLDANGDECGQSGAQSMRIVSELSTRERKMRVAAFELDKEVQQRKDYMDEAERADFDKKMNDLRTDYAHLRPYFSSLMETLHVQAIQKIHTNHFKKRSKLYMSTPLDNDDSKKNVDQLTKWQKQADRQLKQYPLSIAIRPMDWFIRPSQWSVPTVGKLITKPLAPSWLLV